MCALDWMICYVKHLNLKKHSSISLLHIDVTDVSDVFVKLKCLSFIKTLSVTPCCQHVLHGVTCHVMWHYIYSCHLWSDSTAWRIFCTPSSAGVCNRHHSNTTARRLWHQRCNTADWLWTRHRHTTVGWFGNEHRSCATARVWHRTWTRTHTSDVLSYPRPLNRAVIWGTEDWWDMCLVNAGGGWSVYCKNIWMSPKSVHSVPTWELWTIVTDQFTYILCEPFTFEQVLWAIHIVAYE